MLDIFLWAVAAVLFLTTGVRWLLLPLPVSWAAWAGFCIGAAAGAHLSNGSMPILLTSGFALAAAAYFGNGYRLAFKYGLVGPSERHDEEEAALTSAFREFDNGTSQPLSRDVRDLAGRSRRSAHAEQTETWFRFNESEITSLLERTEGMQNSAWLASARSAVHSMEHNWLAGMFPKLAAARVYKKSMAFRKIERGPTSRWHLACLLESLAAMRMLALRKENGQYLVNYAAARDRVLARLSQSPKPVGEPLVGAVSRATPGTERRAGERKSSVPLHSIAAEFPSDAFAECWRAAIQHLDGMVQDGIQNWLKGRLAPPFLEHLSFRLGNQVYFVRLEDVDGRVLGPGTRKGLHFIANGYGGWPCLMPMKRIAGSWQAEEPSWGLLDARNGRPIDPVALISDEEIEMTDWELQELGVQVVRQQIENEGKRVTSSQGTPDMDPSIWFEGSHGHEWVVVRTVRFPHQTASQPRLMEDIKRRCRELGSRGHFASVAVARAPASLEPSEMGRLLRGHGMHVRYTGLEQIHPPSPQATPVAKPPPPTAGAAPQAARQGSRLQGRHVPAEAPNEAFLDCWRAAGKHLNGMAERPAMEWHKADLQEPVLEHLSFRLGNQLFFILVHDVGEHAVGPSSMERLLSVAGGCNGRACIMPMHHHEGGWKPDSPGWGLIDARTGDVVDPPALVTDEHIELTDWEVQDFAVQVVRNALKRQGHRVRYSQGNPSVDPSIWFAENGQFAWVAVRAARFPDLFVHVPHNWHQISADCALLSSVGHFASVLVAGGEERHGEEPDIRLLRGHPLYARFEGLRKPSEEDIAAAEEDFVGRGRLASRRHKPPPRR